MIIYYAGKYGNTIDNCCQQCKHAFLNSVAANTLSTLVPGNLVRTFFNVLVTNCKPGRHGDMNQPIIETHHLDFSFTSQKKILHDLNLHVPGGSIYCFLGPNGAGKTTTIRLLLGLLKSARHTISIFGAELLANRRSILARIGSLIEQPSLYTHLTAAENLEVYRLSYLCDKRRINEVLEIVGLHHASNLLVKTFSLGMKQRLSIAIALLHDPQLLILDEPTNGLDPEGIVEIRQLIKMLHSEFGKTILVSSHLLSEVEKIATHFGIIHKGKLLFQGTKEALQQMQPEQHAVELETIDAERTAQLLKHKFVVKKMNDSVLHVNDVKKEQIPALAEMLVQEKIAIYKIASPQNNLEEIFFKIIAS